MEKVYDYKNDAYDITEEINSLSLDRLIGILHCLKCQNFDSIYFDGREGSIVVYKHYQPERLNPEGIMKWISVEDELPNKDEIVLASSYGVLYLAQMQDGEMYNEHWIIKHPFLYEELAVTGPITHWTRFSSPPTDTCDSLNSDYT